MQRSQVQPLIPTRGSSRLPVTSAPGCLPPGAHTYIHKNENFKNKLCCRHSTKPTSTQPTKCVHASAQACAVPHNSPASPRYNRHATCGCRVSVAVSNDAFDERDDLRDVLGDSQVHGWRQNLGGGRGVDTKGHFRAQDPCTDLAGRGGSHPKS